MRLVTLSACALAALFTLPAHAQSAACQTDRDTLAELEARNLHDRNSGAGDENEYRDEYARLNREIAEAKARDESTSGLENERADVLETLNNLRVLRERVDRRDKTILTIQARLKANNCRTPPPWVRSNQTAGPVTLPPNGKHPWENSYRPSPAPKEPVLQVRNSADVGKNYVEPATTFMNGTANNWEELPPAPEPPIANPGAAANYTAWMTGRFKTEFGAMTLSPGGGSYDYYGGTLTVTRINGATMEGRWHQTQSGGQCADGSHQGAFKFIFTERGFTGSWWRCDGSSGGSWSGTRE